MTHPSTQGASPVGHYLQHYPGPCLSPDGGYVVLPRTVLEQLPPALQQQITYVLPRIDQAMATAVWPAHRVVPSRWMPVNQLDESGLREVGLLAELDANGGLVYREVATGRQLTDAETRQQVLVTVPSR